MGLILIWGSLMRYRDPFQIYPRTLASGKKIYYYTVYDKWNRRKQYSTGQTSRSAARKYCLERFKHNTLLPTGRIRFSDFTRDMFMYDRCAYVQGKIVRGYTYSRSLVVAGKYPSQPLKKGVGGIV